MSKYFGGHSINDDSLKAGFAVTGLVDPDRIITNAGALPGDALLLTKPLGTGIIAFAVQIGRLGPAAAEAIVASMASLNRAASELMLELGALVDSANSMIWVLLVMRIPHWKP